MKKEAQLLVIIALSAILLSIGCTSKQAADIDKDGYPDAVDDFPNDANFHEKTTIWEQENLILQKGQGADKDYAVDNGVKIIVVNWTVVSPSNLSLADQNNITLEITTPLGAASNSTVYAFNEVNDRNLRFSVNDSMRGNWNFALYYSLDATAGNVTINTEIYAIE